MLLDGRTLTFEVPPLIINSRTLIPLRFVAEAFDVKVDWNPATWTVTITSR